MTLWRIRWVGNSPRTGEPGKAYACDIRSAPWPGMANMWTHLLIYKQASKSYCASTGWTLTATECSCYFDKIFVTSCAESFQNDKFQCSQRSNLFVRLLQVFAPQCLSHYTEYLTCLTHWGRVTHICVSKLTIIGSDNGLSPGRRQAIIWTNAGILLIGA